MKNIKIDRINKNNSNPGVKISLSISILLLEKLFSITKFSNDGT